MHLKLKTGSNTLFSDEEFVARIIRGEKNLYEALIRKYNARMYRISRAIINDDQEAEDIMQTAYFNAYLHLNDFKSESLFSTWLTKILINESLLQKKRKQKINQIATDQPENDNQTKTPLQDLMNVELKAILEKTISDLPEKYRLVFVMREIEDMSVNETMDVLNLSESNVKVRLNRAKEMLRTNLSTYYTLSQVYDFHLSRCNRVTESVMGQIDTMKRNYAA
jgi:RNA polymerase sigma factor (sigma-70 family)